MTAKDLETFLIRHCNSKGTVFDVASARKTISAVAEVLSANLTELESQGMKTMLWDNKFPDSAVANSFVMYLDSLCKSLCEDEVKEDKVRNGIVCLQVFLAKYPMKKPPVPSFY